MSAYDSSDLDPARLGDARLGYTRLGVFSGKYQRLLRKVQRQFTRRVPNWHTPRDKTTGWSEPTHEDIAINGLLIDKEANAGFEKVGVIVWEDAVLVTLDGIFVGDQIYDAVTDRYFFVADKPKEVYDADKSFAFRVCQLRLQPYYRLGSAQGFAWIEHVLAYLEGLYNLCVLPNTHIVAQPLAPYSLCVRPVEYIPAVIPTSVYGLCVLANDYETPSPASEYWFDLLPKGEDFDPVAGWTWDVESGNWSVVAEGVTGNCYHEDSGAGISHSDLVYIRPVHVTLEVLVENGVNDAWAGIRLYTGADCIEMRYYPRKYEQSLLTSNAAAGQKVVAVADGTRFYAGYFVTLVDGGDSENIVVGTIAGNTLTMQTNLVNSYHVITSAYCWRYYSEAYIYNESGELLRQITDWASDMWLTMQIDLYRGSTSDAYVGAFKAYIEGVQLNKDAAMATVTHRHTNLGCSMFPFDKVSLVTANGAIGRFDDISFTYQTTLEATE